MWFQRFYYTCILIKLEQQHTNTHSRSINSIMESAWAIVGKQQEVYAVVRIASGWSDNWNELTKWRNFCFNYVTFYPCNKQTPWTRGNQAQMLHLVASSKLCSKRCECTVVSKHVGYVARVKWRYNNHKSQGVAFTQIATLQFGVE